jgi:hypothetical protein
MDKKFFFMRPLLDRLAQGAFFCRMVAITLRVVAALIVLFSLVTFFEAGKLVFKLPAHGILGGVLFEVFFVLAVYAVVHVLLIRARDIEQIKAADFYALPVGAILLRLIGEAYAAFVALVAVGGGIFVWFTNMKLASVLNPFIRTLFPTVRDDPSFMGGIEFMVSGVLIAVVVLVLAYALSEAVAVLARAANRNGSEARPAETGQGYRSRFGSF